MKKKTKRRDKSLKIRLNEEEEQKLIRLRGKTTANSLSEYARDVLLKEPVTVFHRNQSADDFLIEMIELKKELNAIGKNFNQMVHKLHMLDHQHQVEGWAVQNEYHKKQFFSKAQDIQKKLNQIYELWSQE